MCCAVVVLSTRSSARDDVDAIERVGRFHPFVTRTPCPLATQQKTAEKRKRVVRVILGSRPLAKALRVDSRMIQKTHQEDTTRILVTKLLSSPLPPPPRSPPPPSTSLPTNIPPPHTTPIFKRKKQSHSASSISQQAERPAEVDLSKCNRWL